MAKEKSFKSQYYKDYLGLNKILDSQNLISDEFDQHAHDEMLFIITHQVYELWFKQIIRELSEVRNILCQEQVPEKDIPRAVESLGRTTEIFKLMATQWSVMETLTPQGFLSFRDGLGSASGFESFQMRKFEILLGLKNEDRLFGMDPIDTFRKLAKNSEKDADILQDLEGALAMPSLETSLMKWISRTPIMGSIYGSENDSESVKKYVNEHLLAHKSMSNAPYFTRGKNKDEMIDSSSLKSIMMHDGLTDSFDGTSMGMTGEIVAEEFNLSKELADSYAVRSHALANAAWKNGWFETEIIDMEELDIDQGIRPGTNMESLANLKTVFKENGQVTAGNASQVSDGASAVLVCSEDFARDETDLECSVSTCSLNTP